MIKRRGRVAEKSPETKSQFMAEVDSELESLRQICYAFDALNDEQRVRSLKYLKSKYASNWPSEGY